MVVYNVHNLIHVADDAFIHGSFHLKILWATFEKLVKKTLQQVITAIRCRKTFRRKWQVNAVSSKNVTARIL